MNARLTRSSTCPEGTKGLSLGFQPQVKFTSIARPEGAAEKRLAENPERLAEFLDSLPKENGSGIAPIGYEYREYKNWRGIPKPRRCPFCKQAKGKIRRKSGAFLGVCPNWEARGPKRESYEEVLRAWNGKG